MAEDAKRLRDELAARAMQSYLAMALFFAAAVLSIGYFVDCTGNTPIKGCPKL